MMRRPPRSTLSSSSAASDVYKRQPYDETACRKFLGSVMHAGETVVGAMKRLRSSSPENFEKVSKICSQMSDNGYLQIYTDPRETIWAHSYAANLDAASVLFGAGDDAADGEEPVMLAPPPQGPQHDFLEPESWWQYCVADAQGNPGEYHGPYAGAQMAEWEKAGYFSGTNVSIFKSQAPAPVYTPAVPEPLPTPPAFGGQTSMAGRRVLQEDRTMVVNNLHSVLAHPVASSFGGYGASLFGVFDGHNGADAAEYCVRHFPGEVAKQLVAAAYTDPGMNPETVKAALIQAFVVVDAKYLEFAKKRKLRDGCTALVALLLNSRLFIANLGDSRAVISRANTAERLTFEHRAGLEGEAARIKAAGGEVVYIQGTYRVKLTAEAAGASGWNMDKAPPMLTVSRTIGDRMFKIPSKLIENIPDVKWYDLGEKDDLIVLGSDGIFEVMTDQEQIDKANQAIDNDKLPSEAARRVVTEAYHRESSDNITVVAIYTQRAITIGQPNSVIKV
eukprot:TRINITY_DN11223_c0_g1_i2.p1 TRINITY_DN11223_c0_g1~~TRINITY_DN11223_c0_g1_i2.p1  ORF type:complete len:504 (+),score=137.45 TRINITY_DN11223_c0_g1_i2:52-1563(+)